MADFGIEDLWYLKPGGGQDPTVGSQWLQGMKFGADQRQTTIENMFKERQIEDQTKRTMIAAQTALAKMSTDTQRDKGIAEISAYLTTVAENNAWTDPKAEAGLLRLFATYPQAVTEGQGLAIHKQMFESAKNMEERAREVDQKEERLRKDSENRAAARVTELEIRQQRANDYGEKVRDTKEWQDFQRAFKDAQSEKDTDIKLRKLEIADRLATVAERKADTGEMIAKARAEFLANKAKQMERGLGPGEATIFRARFEALRDRYQFPTDPKDKLSTEEFNKQLDILVNEFQGKVKPQQGPGFAEPAAPVTADPNDPLGVIKKK